MNNALRTFLFAFLCLSFLAGPASAAPVEVVEADRIVAREDW